MYFLLNGLQVLHLHMWKHVANDPITQSSGVKVNVLHHRSVLEEAAEGRTFTYDLSVN